MNERREKEVKERGKTKVKQGISTQCTAQLNHQVIECADVVDEIVCTW